jgi:CelD/BcsL family acetyltransferase involved in cellulose biosynthesis
LRLLRFISDDRSDYLGFLCAGDVAGAEQALLEQIIQFGEWDLLLLRRLADTYTSLHQAGLPPTFRAHRVKWTNAPYLKGDGDWDAFHKSGPNWLREMRKRSRRFLRDGHSAQRFSASEAVDWLDSVAEIEARSWKGRNASTRLQRGDGSDLLRRAFESLGSSGEIELWIAFVGGRAAAFQIDFVHPGRIWHYQCAYDEEFRDARAGSVLTYISLESAWRRGVREFDYLSGEESYKLERTNGSREIHRVSVHSRTPKGWIAYGLLVWPRATLRNVAALRAIYGSAKIIRRSIRKSAN